MNSQGLSDSVAMDRGIEPNNSVHPERPRTACAQEQPFSRSACQSGGIDAQMRPHWYTGGPGACKRPSSGRDVTQVNSNKGATELRLVSTVRSRRDRGICRDARNVLRLQFLLLPGHGPGLVAADALVQAVDRFRRVSPLGSLHGFWPVRHRRPDSRTAISTAPRSPHGASGRSGAQPRRRTTSANRCDRWPHAAPTVRINRGSDGRCDHLLDLGTVLVDGKHAQHGLCGSSDALGLVGIPRTR